MRNLTFDNALGLASRSKIRKTANALLRFVPIGTLMNDESSCRMMPERHPMVLLS